VRIPGDADQRSGMMPITILFWSRSGFRCDGDQCSVLMAITYRQGPERWSRYPGKISTGWSGAGHDRRQAVPQRQLRGETACQPGDCPWNVPADVMWPSELKWWTGRFVCS